ncbi:hypothetical protein JCM11491_003196 [Sporobolomyces phaffii]
MSAYHPTGHRDRPPASATSANTHGSLHQSSFHNLTLEHSLEDLSARFIVNLPAEELESMDRVCFQIEQAHWYYEDFIRPAALNPGLLPSYGLKAFSLLMFRSCPLLHDLLPNHNKIWNSFMAYKERVPVCGAIIISQYWDKVLLVKGWTKGSSWSFPRGKINKEEPEAMCAVREVLEETGFDMTEYFHPSQFEPGHIEDEGSERVPYYVELVIKEQKIRLYFIPGVQEDTVFETRTRKEISKIEWFKLNDLPTWSKDKKGRTTRTKAQLEGRQAKFYMVTPFISHLKLWIDHHKPKNLPLRPSNGVSPRANLASPLPSPNLQGRDLPHSYGDQLHDDATYHLPSEVELGDSTSAEADSTEDEFDDFLQSASEPVSFETTQQGTDALNSFFFGSPPAAPSNPLPLSPPSRSQSFEVASTPPHIAYERQSSFLQPKPQPAKSQQTTLLELLSGAIPSPPPPSAPSAQLQHQALYSEPQLQPPRSNESRSLLHLLNDVNLCDSPTTPQDASSPAFRSPIPSQQPHSILFSDSQAPPEAADFGLPLPAHLHPDRNDSERKEKHNALLRALFSVATRPTPAQASADGASSPLTTTTTIGHGKVGSYSGSIGWTAPGEQYESNAAGSVSGSRRGTLGGGGGESAVGKNGEPYGPDEDEEIWPPPVMRRNQLYPLETPQPPDLPDAYPQPSVPPPNGAGGGGSLLSILNGGGGQRAQPPPQPSPFLPTPPASAGIAPIVHDGPQPKGKDPLELLREHRARQLGQDLSPPPAPVTLPPIVQPRASPLVESNQSLPSPQAHPPLPILPPPPAPPASTAYPGLQPHYYLQPPHAYQANPLAPNPQFPPNGHPLQYPQQSYAAPPVPPAPSMQPPQYFSSAAPHPSSQFAPVPHAHLQPHHHPLPTTGPPLIPSSLPQPHLQPQPQPQPQSLRQRQGPPPPPTTTNPINLESRNDFPPLPTASTAPGRGNAGALLGLLNAKG